MESLLQKARSGWSLKRYIAVLLTVVIGFSLVGCKSGEGETKEGKKDNSENQGIEASLGIGGYVYVPQYTPLSTSGFLQNVLVEGDCIYYSVFLEWDEETLMSQTKYFRMRAGEKEPEKISLEYDNQDGNFDIISYAVGTEDNLYVLFRAYNQEEDIQEEAKNGTDATAGLWQLSSYSYSSVGAVSWSSEGREEYYYYLGKYDSSGKEIFLKNITEDLLGGEEENDYYIYIDKMLIDGQNHLYLSMGESVYLFDGEGNSQGVIDLGGYPGCFGTDRDGNVYCLLYDPQSGGNQVCLLDYAAKAIGEGFGNVPNIYNDFVPGLEKDFLMYDGDGVYEYDLASRSFEKILNWLDCDIFGSSVRGIVSAGDGRLMAVIESEDEEGESYVELAYLTKTPVSEVEQKEVITIGSFYSPTDDFQSRIVKFNKQNQNYHVSLKLYYDPDVSEEDARKTMNMELISGNGPDLLCVNDTVIDVESLAKKGVIEDLTPYFDKSEKVHKEDYVESVLNAYTFDGLLACIPTSFDIHTVAGRSSQVGDEMGWSLDELMALMDANPDAEPFVYSLKAEILRDCLVFNQSAFVDYANGTCNFDSGEFRKVLEFANRFSSEFPDLDERNEVEMIEDGSVLLHEVDLYRPEEITSAPQYFGGDDITYIGYPTLDGSVGCFLLARTAFALLSASAHKEGAWAFVEYFLEQEAREGGSQRMGLLGFSSSKAILDSQLSEASAHPYETDENGKVVLDENGEPVRWERGATSYSDGTTIYEYEPLPEEIDIIRELIDVARPLSMGDTEILSMILEEAEPYFQGQKTVDEVMDVIQGRVKIYISENY